MPASPSAIFFVVALVLLTLLASAFYESTPGRPGTPSARSFTGVGRNVTAGGLFGGFGFIIVCISSCILAYSGIESVVQTAGLVKGWRDIGKAYIFLAVTTGTLHPAHFGAGAELGHRPRAA